MGHIWEKLNQKYAVVLLTVLGVYFFVKYFLPLVYPLVIAALIVVPIHPYLEKIEKKTHIGKGFLTVGLLLLCGSLLLLGVWCAASWCIGHLGGLMSGLDIFERQLCCFVSDCSHFLERTVGFDAGRMETLILERVNIFIENFQIRIMPQLMQQSLYWVKGVFGVAAFLAITLIAAVLLAKDFDSVAGKIRQLSGAHYLFQIMTSIGRMVLTFLRAQLIIMGCISITAALGLWLAKIPGAVALGILAGLLDALPFIGTGIVLIPTALWQMVQGKLMSAFVCVLLYAACAFLRELLEPRLIGKRMGVLPIVILASVYVGVKVYGLGGIILGPLSVLVIREILSLFCEKGDINGEYPQKRQREDQSSQD